MFFCKICLIAWICSNNNNKLFNYFEPDMVYLKFIFLLLCKVFKKIQFLYKPEKDKSKLKKYLTLSQIIKKIHLMVK